MPAKRHGMTYTRTYKIWAGMKVRCYNVNHKDYPYYGGRGVRVSERWMLFDNFFEDMGEAPEGLTLERKDRGGDYCQENCEWATRKTQARNCSYNRIIEVNGVSRVLSEWAEISGIGESVIRGRLKRGWSPEKAVSTPARFIKPKVRRTHEMCEEVHRLRSLGRSQDSIGIELGISQGLVARICRGQ